MPTHIKELTADPQNRRTHTPRNIGMLVDAIHKVGAARSIVVDENDVVLAGNGVLEAAAEAGLTKVQVVEADGETVIAVRRRGLTDDQKRDLAIYDNRTAELASWNAEQLAIDMAAGLDLTPFWTDEELQALQAQADDAAIDTMAQGGAKAADDPDRDPGAEHATFSCPLTLAQERAVRAVLQTARRTFGVTTTGDALTAALTAWSEQHGADVQEATG